MKLLNKELQNQTKLNAMAKRKNSVKLDAQDLIEIEAQLKLTPKISNINLAKMFKVSGSYMGQVLHDLGLRTKKSYKKKEEK